MKKQNGFTLIELVVVIVILGILAVTAAPKFLNLQDDAKVSAVKGLAGAMKGAAGITYGKAAIAGLDSVSSATSLSIPSVSGGVQIIYGYPTATDSGIAKVVDGLDTDWVKVSNPPSAATNSISYGYQGFGCVATYTQALDAYTPATVTVSTTDDNISNCSLSTATGN
ncbi:MULTISPECIES: type II secretion system protein [Vibrio]|uniref:type II secretion system protein n=1 Tax=Vibrio TaxID=662 RepID=UPI000B5CB625|nr:MULTISPECIES: type II secretion system protein [Vibrio]HBV77192.1 type II secretion system protein [Vibrio sp.]